MLAANVTPNFQPLKPSSAIVDIILSNFAVFLSSLGCDPLKLLVLPRTASHGTHVGDDLKFALPANWIDLSLISEKAGKSEMMLMF